MEEHFDSVESLVSSEAFQKYILNPNEEDIMFWNKWIKGNLNRRGMIKEARELVLNFSHQLSDRDIEQEKRRMKQAIMELDQPMEATDENSQNRILKILKLLALLVSFTLIVGLAFYLFKPNSGASIVLKTDFGKTLFHEFADSSKVYLNANSTLIVPRNWGGERDRSFDLNGEAFFIFPNHAEAKAFTVRTKQGEIKGQFASFNIRDRADDFETVLAIGLATVSLPEHLNLRLTAGERMSFRKGKIDTQYVATEMYSAWKENKMVFKDASIYHVIRRLRDDFNIELTFQNKKILRENITVTLPKDDPIQLLDTLAIMYHLQLEQLTPRSYLIR